MLFDDIEETEAELIGHSKATCDALAFLQEGHLREAVAAGPVNDEWMRHMTALNLAKRQVNLLFLTDQIDTTTALGRFFFQVCASFAELERERIRERTQAGLRAARARGRKGGRPPALKEVDPRNIELARQLYEANDPHDTVAALCKNLLGGISTKTFYRHIATKKQSA